MSWVRLDDQMPDSLKIAPLSDAAFRAYVTSICYAARQLTDGFVPLKVGNTMAGRARVVQELVPCLWTVSEGGYLIHDYLVYNPTRELVLAERAEKHEAKVKAGQAGAAKRWQGDSRRITEGVAKPKQNDGPVPPPVPDPLPLTSGGGGRRNIFQLYENTFGPMDHSVSEELKALEDEYPAGCVEHCFKAAVMKVPRPNSLRWVITMLQRHQREGCDVRAPFTAPVLAGTNGRKSHLYDD